MSTRGSLIYEADEVTGQTVHLYEDVFDDDHVYVEVRGFPFEASSQSNCLVEDRAGLPSVFRTTGQMSWGYWPPRKSPTFISSHRGNFSFLER